MRIVASLVLFFTLLAALSTPSGAQSSGASFPDPELYESLHWRFIGPEGNRFSSSVGIPGDPYTYYVGAASGGIYKTTDGGVNWEREVSSPSLVGNGFYAMVVAPDDPNKVVGYNETGRIAVGYPPRPLAINVKQELQTP